MCLIHKDLTVYIPAGKSTTTYSIFIFKPKVLLTASANQGESAHSKDQIVDDRNEIKWILTKRVTRRGLDSCSSGQGPLPEQCKYANKYLGWEKRGEVRDQPISSHEGVSFNPLNPELNPICYLLALLGAHHFLHVSRKRVKLLTFRQLMSYIYGAPILDVSRSHTTTQHSR